VAIPSMDTLTWFRKQVDAAEADLLREMITSFAGALMGAEDVGPDRWATIFHNVLVTVSAAPAEGHRPCLVWWVQRASQSDREGRITSATSATISVPHRARGQLGAAPVRMPRSAWRDSTCSSIHVPEDDVDGADQRHQVRQ